MIKSKSKETKTGIVVTENYCRRCMQMLPASKFYDCVDMGFVDSNGLMSVCKNCIQNMYDEIYDETKSIEKTIHKLCTSLNIKYSNDAVSALHSHIDTLLKNGKKVHAVFGIYKMKLVATKSSMDKSKPEDMTYEDVGTIYMREDIDTTEIPIPEEIASFWGVNIDGITEAKERAKAREKVEFLEREYTSFKKTHKADTYSEVSLLKQVCYTLWDIEEARRNNDETKYLLKTLQDLMGNLAISPKESNSSKEDKQDEAFGLWIQDIEQKEPAQWLEDDPRGDMYRDVGNVEKYFDDYFVRPLKNFVTQSKDFKINTEGDEIVVSLVEEDTEEELSVFDDLDE
jgi:hypothetical protein